MARFFGTNSPEDNVHHCDEKEGNKDRRHMEDCDRDVVVRKE
jgi:hypothetical protein